LYQKKNLFRDQHQAVKLQGTSLYSEDGGRMSSSKL